MRSRSFVCGLIIVSCSLLMFSCNQEKDSCGPCKFEILADSVMDVDYNLYSKVRIGDQIWLGENLKTRHYADGSVIDMNDTILSARYAFPAGQVDSARKYGMLYNWAAARRLKDNTPGKNPVQGICPDGYHLPSDQEWQKLVDFVSNCTSSKTKTSVAKSLAANDTLWKHSTVPNTPGCAPDSNNASSFAALPAGHCIEDIVNGEFRCYNFYGGANFWSADPFNGGNDEMAISNPNAYGRYIGYNGVQANKTVSSKKSLFSVRCVKN